MLHTSNQQRCRSIILQTQTNQLIGKIRFMVTRGRGCGEGELDEAVKRYKLPVIKELGM